MRLDYRHGQYVFDCRYEERDIPKAARFWFNRKIGRWVTRSHRCAMRLRQYATQAAREQFVDFFTRGVQFHDISMYSIPKFKVHLSRK